MSFTRDELLFIKQLLTEQQERNRTMKGPIVDMSVERNIAEILETTHSTLRPAASIDCALH
jgi:hypothetical protein